jgi:uncharacterized protein YkwD
MRKLLLLLFLIIALGSVFIFWESVFKTKIISEKELPSLIEEFKEKITAPPPLVLEVHFPQSFLTKDGIIQWTNKQRIERGLPQLKENSELNSSAALKIQDMLAKQYFAHISPDGTSVGDLVKSVGYEFIAIGENLALGDFENDEKLVQSWMASEGHRANILNSQYREIGVAVFKGEFKGRLTWLAVQHFGTPLSVCPQLSKGLSHKITQNQRLIEELRNRLTKLQGEIQSMKPWSDSDYSQKVEEYNTLVLQFNNLIDETKRLIELYNSEVRTFNECVNNTLSK